MLPPFCCEDWVMWIVRSLLFVLLLSPVFSLDAMWLALEEKQLLGDSQLIVRGVLDEKSISVSAESHLRTLRVKRVYKGDREAKRILFRVPSPNRPLSSNDLVFPGGQEGIWFLKEVKPGAGVYFIDHPQRFWPVEEELRLLKLLDGISAPPSKEEK